MIVRNKSVDPPTIVDTGDISYFFDALTEHSISVQNQITDNYIESNTAVQDHIAHSPITVSVKGLVGQVVYTPPLSYSNFLVTWKYDPTNKTDLYDRFMTEKLGVLSALLPPVDNITQAAKDAAQYLEAVNRRSLFYNNLLTKERKERLKKVYDALIKVRNQNKLLTVHTPFKTFDNMAIQSISLSQGNINYAGDVEITFKQVQFAETKTTDPDKNVMVKYTEVQRAEEVNNGKAQGKTVSLTKDFLNKYNLLGATEGNGIRN